MNAYARTLAQCNTYTAVDKRVALGMFAMKW